MYQIYGIHTNVYIYMQLYTKNDEYSTLDMFKYVSVYIYINTPDDMHGYVISNKLNANT